MKGLRKEIERRLDLVGRIKHEPKLVCEASSADTHNSDTLCRMQAMDDIKILGILQSIALLGQMVNSFIGNSAKSNWVSRNPTTNGRS